MPRKLPWRVVGSDLSTDEADDLLSNMKRHSTGKNNAMPCTACGAGSHHGMRYKLLKCESSTCSEVTCSWRGKVLVCESCLAALSRVFSWITQLRLMPRFIMGDAGQGQRNAVFSVFQNNPSMEYLMCFYHVMTNVEKRLKEFSSHAASAIIGRLYDLLWCSDFQVIAEVATFKLLKLRTLGHATGGDHGARRTRMHRYRTFVGPDYDQDVTQVGWFVSVKLDSHSAVKNRRTTVLRLGDGSSDSSVGATSS